ncbi:hypothetical protein CGRA01v4_00266 [Colletotrichum graminicola]|nr:hypothetical protein CGRA01v4_00266 [Colletotrichum graminicola]
MFVPCPAGSSPDFVLRRDDARLRGAGGWPLAPREECVIASLGCGPGGARASRAFCSSRTRSSSRVIMLWTPSALSHTPPSLEGLLAVPRRSCHQPGLVLIWRVVTVAGTVNLVNVIHGDGFA